MFAFPAVVFESPLGTFVVTFPDLSECVAFSSSLATAPAAAAQALDRLMTEMEIIGETNSDAVEHRSHLGRTLNIRIARLFS
jgi:predicted RNase H-like HicB family nuclease